MSMLGGSMASGSLVTGTIESGLASSLGSAFGLPPLATGVIAVALPGILAKFAHKANDPNDASITLDNMQSSFSGSDSLSKCLETCSNSSL